MCYNDCNMKRDNQRQTALYSYLAGIIDGEGTITIMKNPKRYIPLICCGMTSKKIISLLAEKLEGNTYIERVPENRKQMYRWRISGREKILKALEKIMPYLIEKQNQAKILKEFIENTNFRTGQLLVRKCQECQSVKKIHGYNLCATCLMRARRSKNLNKYKSGHIEPRFLSTQEIRRREELYRNIKKLNVRGVAATK